VTELTPRFDEAVTEARRLHGGQRRKGTGIPYVAHLLSVAAIVLEDGGSEEEALAALLHDVIEDVPGEGTEEFIREHFGGRVADIVRACSDATTHPKPPWRKRKEDYLAHLETAPPDVLRVSLADKLHNARAILYDLRTVGDEVWSRFAASNASDQLWYYRSLADVFSRRKPGPLAEELQRVVDEIGALAGPSGSEEGAA
jgi:(p)ppGpp synthase/HD superfamily hydrolase